MIMLFTATVFLVNMLEKFFAWKVQARYLSQTS